jgi:hypothetical protein
LPSGGERVEKIDLRTAIKKDRCETLRFRIGLFHSYFLNLPVHGAQRPDKEDAFF